MVIERSGVQFGLKSYVWIQTKIARHEVWIPLNYIHFESPKFTKMQDFVFANILLIQ